MFLFLMVMAALWIIAHIVIVRVSDKKEKDWEEGPGQRDYGRKNYPSFCRWYNGNSSLFTTMTVLSTLFILITSICIMNGQYNSAAFAKKYEATALTYQERKNNFSELERVAAFKTVVYLAEELAAYKYTNEAFYGIMDIFVSDEINKLQPIR